jgi:hypothetical protein
LETKSTEKDETKQHSLNYFHMQGSSYSDDGISYNVQEMKYKTNQEAIVIHGGYVPNTSHFE